MGDRPCFPFFPVLGDNDWLDWVILILLIFLICLVSCCCDKLYR